MKKIFTLAIVLMATTSVASAQEKLMKINKTDGTSTEIEVSKIKNFTFENSSWKSLGYCLYGEDFIGSAVVPSGGSSGDLCCEYYVEVQENIDKPGLYRLVNPYGPDNYPYAQYTTYETGTDHYVEINATDPDCVYIEYQYTGMSWNTIGAFYVYCLALYYIEVQGVSWDTIQREGYFGKLEDGVITFPTKCLASRFPTYSTAYNYGNSNDNFKVDTTDTSDTGGAKNAKRTNAQGATLNLRNLLTAEEVEEIKSMQREE